MAFLRRKVKKETIEEKNESLPRRKRRRNSGGSGFWDGVGAVLGGALDAITDIDFIDFF